jgi:hypothetical protein
MMRSIHIGIGAALSAMIDIPTAHTKPFIKAGPGRKTLRSRARTDRSKYIPAGPHANTADAKRWKVA